MKQLLILLFLITFTETFGHKCYECNERIEDQSCKDPIIENCSSDRSQNYCATILLKRKVNETQRFAKSCLHIGYEYLCESKSSKDWITCCKGELCNNANKLSSKTIVVILSFISVMLAVY